VSWRGVAILTTLLAGYFYLRFGYLGTGSPELVDRATGFGVGRLERDEVAARFADAPYVFYAYNVMASILSVLVAEPRGGTFEMTRRWLAGEVTPSVVVALLSSIGATGMLVWFTIRRFRSWLAFRFEHADQLLLVCLGVLAANAAISYAYVKDEIMSTAGVFYALAVCAVVSAALSRFAERPRRVLTSVAVTVLLLVTSAAWAIRSTGLHYHMYYSGYYLRNEWATVEVWLREQQVQVTSRDGRRLVESLRTAAIELPALNPHFLPRWAERWFA
jgi:hypothetical protein